MCSRYGEASRTNNEESHHSRYFVHPGSTKMYHNLKEVYLWNDVKKNIADFFAEC